MRKIPILLFVSLAACATLDDQEDVGDDSDDVSDPSSSAALVADGEVSAPDVAPTVTTTYAAPGTFSDVTVTNGVSSLHIVPEPADNRIWDFDTVVSGTSISELRFFRHTLTTGLVSLALEAGNGIATHRILLAGNSASYFRDPVGFGNTSPDYKFDISAVNETARTTSNRLLNVDTVNSTFDTTAGPLTSYGGYFASRSTRATGTQPLTNAGLYASAPSPAPGTINYSGYFDQGDVRVGGHTIAGGTTVVATACGSSPVVIGDDQAGTITEGGTAMGCTITFATPYNTAPTCVVMANGVSHALFTYTTSTTAITVTNLSSLFGVKINYICQGH